MHIAACCSCASLIQLPASDLQLSDAHTETFMTNSTHHALSEALRHEHIPAVITALHMHRGSSVWEYRRRNNPCSPANCVYPGWRRRPLTGPDSVHLRAPRWLQPLLIQTLWTIFNVRAMLLTVYSLPASYFFLKTACFVCVLPMWLFSSKSKSKLICCLLSCTAHKFHLKCSQCILCDRVHLNSLYVVSATQGLLIKTKDGSRVGSWELLFSLSKNYH